MINSTVCGIRVALWGAKADQHFGLETQFEQRIYGGNVGHAALSMTIPVTPENTELIKKYCGYPQIPVQKLKVSTPKAVQNEDGEWIASETQAFEEEVYVVTVSWWPGGGHFLLHPTINEDGYYEREGVHVAWEEEYKQYIGFEERIHTGQLRGKTKASYAPLHMVHERGLAKEGEEHAYLGYLTALKHKERELDSLMITSSKLKQKCEKKRDGSRVELSENELLILDRFIPEWKTLLSTQKSPYPVSEVRLLSSKLNLQVEKKQVERQEITTQLLAIQDDVLLPKETRALLKDELTSRQTIKAFTALDPSLTTLIDKIKVLTDPAFMQFLSDDKILINETELKPFLDALTRFSGIDYRALMGIEKKQPIEIIHIKQLSQQLSNYKLKKYLLATLLEHFDPLSSKYLNDDQSIQVTSENEGILRLIAGGVDLPNFILNTDPFPSSLTKKELSDIIETYHANYKTSIEVLSEKIRASDDLKLQVCMQDQTSVMTEEKEQAIHEVHAIQEFYEQDYESKMVLLNEAYKNVNYLIQNHNKAKNNDDSIKLSEFGSTLKTHDALDAAFKRLGQTDWFNSTFGAIDTTVVPEIGDLLKMTQEEIEEAIDESSNPKHTRQQVDTILLHFKIEHYETLRDELKNQLQATHAALIDTMPTLSNYQAQDFEQFVTMGIPPEVDLTLPLSASSGSSNSHERGLDVEAMLKEIHKMQKEGAPFDLNTNNCSVAVERTLAAGTDEPYLKEILQKRVLGLSTPQQLANTCTEYLSEVQNKTQDTFLKRLNRFSPFETLFGRQIETLVDNNKTKGQKRVALLLAIPLGIAAILTSSIKALVLPKTEFPTAQTKALFKLAMDSKNPILKGLAFVVGGFSTLIALPSALLSGMVLGPIRGVQALIKKLAPSKSDDLDSNEEKPSTLKTVGEAQTASNRLITIKNTDPEQALIQFEQELSNGNIPLFDTKTRLNLEQYLDQRNDPVLTQKYTADLKEAISRVQLVQESTEENQAAPPAPTGIQAYHEEVRKIREAQDSNIPEDLRQDITALDAQLKAIESEIKAEFIEHGLSLQHDKIRIMSTLLDNSKRDVGDMFAAFQESQDLSRLNTQIQYFKSNMANTFAVLSNFSVGNHVIAIPSLNKEKEPVAELNAPKKKSRKSALLFSSHETSPQQDTDSPAQKKKPKPNNP